MNTPIPPTSNSSSPMSGDEFSHLESDLLPIVAGLEKLARMESVADAAFEDRLLQATLGALHGVQPVSAQAAELGALDRAGAPQNLEQSVYEASVPALQEAAAPRLVIHAGGAEHNERRHVRVARRAWWSSAPFRMAALVAVVAGVAIGLRNGPTPKAPESVSDRVSREMDALFAAVEHVSGDSKDRETGAEYDPDKLSEWLSEGAAS